MPEMSRRRVVPPSKEWIYAPRYSPRWVIGVQSFIQFTSDCLGESSKVRCPCMKCKNFNSSPKSLEDVHGDILENGFDMTYQTWIHHGEQPSDHVFNVEAPPLPANYVVNEDVPVSRMHDLFHETLGRAVGVNNSENCRKISRPGEVYEGPYPRDSHGKTYKLTTLEYDQVRLWILRHSDENTEWEAKYKMYLSNLNRTRRGRTESMDYIAWLRGQLEGTPITDFHRLVLGPTFNTVSYNSYCVNGYLFYTADAEKNLTTQNSGVTMNACTSFRASSRDTNLVDDDTTYYGILQKIVELDYGVFTEVVFYCDWVRVEDKVHGSYVDPETKLRFVNFEKFARSSKEEDEPFIHASQASQVFYCRDLTRQHWNLVLESPMRSDPHMNAFEDPYVFTATSGDAPLISETVGHDEYWNGVAEGDDEYSDVDAQELAECGDDEYSD